MDVPIRTCGRLLPNMSFDFLISFGFSRSPGPNHFPSQVRANSGHEKDRGQGQGQGSGVRGGRDGQKGVWIQKCPLKEEKKMKEKNQLGKWRKVANIGEKIIRDREKDRSRSNIYRNRLSRISFQKIRKESCLEDKRRISPSSSSFLG